MEHIDGELAELSRDGKKMASAYTMVEKQDFYSELIAYSISKGFKSGWAYYAYKDKFGVFPGSTLSKKAKLPSAAVLSWIRHRNIVKAKSRSK